MNTKVRVIIFIVSVILIILLIRIELNQTNRRHSEYTNLEISHQLKDIVIDVKKNKGVCYIVTHAGKFIISPSENRNYRNEYIDENITVGDSIFKQSGSDTIRIYRNIERYIFIHNGIIPKRSDGSKGTSRIPMDTAM